MSDIWTVLAARGRIASLNIGRPRAAIPLNLFVDEITKKRVADEVLPDLGITTRNDKQRKAVDDYIKVGYKLLLPPQYEKAWRSAETGARRTLLKDASETGNGYIFAFRTPFGPFVPLDNLDKWLAKIEEYRTRYMAVSKSLLKDYDAAKREVVENFNGIAGMTYANLAKNNPTLVRGITRAAFVERYVKMVKAFIPSPEEIERETYFRWSLHDISLPEEDRKRVIANAALSPDERDRMKTLNRVAEIVLQTSKSDLGQLESDVNQQLYSVVYNAAEMALRYINAGSLPPKMSQMIDTLVDQVKGLNILDDENATKWVVTMREALIGLRESKDADKESAYDDLKAAAMTARDQSAKRLARFGGVIRATQLNQPGDEPIQRVERRRRVA